MRRPRVSNHEPYAVMIRTQPENVLDSTKKQDPRVLFSHHPMGTTSIVAAVEAVMMVMVVMMITTISGHHNDARAIPLIAISAIKAVVMMVMVVVVTVILRQLDIFIRRGNGLGFIDSLQQRRGIRDRLKQIGE